MPRLATWLLSGSVRLWAMIAAGVVQTCFSAWLVSILTWFPWGGHEQQRIYYLGIGLFISLGNVAIVIAALTSTNFRAHGPAGVSLEVDSSDERNTKAVVTTTVETKPNA